MALTAKFLQPIRFRASFTSITSQSKTPFYGKFQPLKTWMKDIQPLELHFRIPTSQSKTPFYGNFQPLKSWMKDIQPLELHFRIPSFQWKLYAQQFLRRSNFSNSGHEFSMGSIFGISVVLGSVCLWPRVAYSMNGSDVSDDDHHVGLLGASDLEEDRIAFLTFARKLLVPVFLILTVWMNWGHPVILASKAILILFTTKPSPFSVYIFVDQLRRQSLRQHPFLYKFKSLYAKKVEVEDYTFLCVARVELEDQRFTLIGMLGNWWVLQLTPCEEAFSALKNRVLNYIRNSVSEY